MDKEQYNASIERAMLKFVDLLEQGTFATSFKEKISEIRQYILPTDDYSMGSVYDIGQFGSVATSGEALMTTLNPIPYEAIKKATAGFMAFHHTPFEDFFQTKVIPTEIVSDPAAQDNLLRYWKYRDTRVHSIMQQPHNVMQEALFTAERLAFNIGVKTLDPDPSLVVKKTQHKIENAIIFSSDGVNPDILGVVEELNWFQYKLRFPKQATPLKPDQLDQFRKSYDFTLGYGLNRIHSDQVGIRVYRVNMSVKVFNIFMEAILLEEGEEMVKAWQDQFKKEHVLKGKDVLDLIVNDFGQIIEITSRSYKTVHIGHLGFVTKDGVRGKGQGDLALTTSKVLQETEEILMDGYERSFGPSWAMPSALQESIYGMMSRNDIIFTDESDAIRPLTLDIDLNTAKNLATAWEERANSLMFLDIFTLIEKNRMPINEISMRRADGFKQLGLYVAADTAYNLEPEVLAILAMDEEQNEIPQRPAVEGTLRVSFVSPIIQAIKSTTLDEYGRIAALLKAFEELEPGNTTKRVSLAQMTTDVLHKTDHLDALLPVEIQQAKEQLEQMQRQLEVKRMTADANRANAENLMKLREGMGEGGVGQQEAAGGAGGAGPTGQGPAG